MEAKGAFVMKINSYIKFLPVVLLLLNTLCFAQGITIGSSTIFSLGSSTLSLSGNWNNSGTFTPENGTVIFNGPSGNQTITKSGGETFKNLTVNKSAGNVQLQNNITVTGTLTLTSGDVDLNGMVITISSTGTLSESAGNTVKGNTGYITCTKVLNAPAAVNILGAVITSSANLGSTTVVRGHAAQSCSGSSSILRYYDITPINNSSLNATLGFSYDESELNGLSEAGSELYSSTNGGTSWTEMGGTVNTTSNTVTLSGISRFSRWTASSSFAPLANIKVFLEGAYLAGSLTTALKSLGYIPLSQPYNTAPWNYSGAESVISIPTGVVDWVLVELRTGTTAATKAASRAGFLKSDGKIVDLDGSSLLRFSGVSGNYYVVIRHRNHLAIMSAAPITLNSSSTLYLFTTAQTQAYGTNSLKDLGTGNFGMVSGDANKDGQITSTDFNEFNPKFKTAVTGYQTEDWNLDGQITSTDFNIFNVNFKQARISNVP